jgi:hypothetical protein
MMLALEIKPLPASRSLDGGPRKSRRKWPREFAETAERRMPRESQISSSPEDALRGILRRIWATWTHLRERRSMLPIQSR